MALFTALALGAGACANTSGGAGGDPAVAACTKNAANAAACIDPVFDDPKLLRELAKEAGRNEDFERAFFYYKALQFRHPESEEARTAFEPAAVVLRKLYFRYRLRDPHSPWLTSEPYFMFQWLARFYTDETAPVEKIELLFRGMPVKLMRRFKQFAPEEPMLARWTYETERDNGYVESITVTRAY